jgi:SAM-dependent methyltransferase
MSRPMSTAKFYDDLSPYYDLIFPDWEASMGRQGDALVDVIREELSAPSGAMLRVLDAAAGIGTQSLPLAARGFTVTARDLSRRALERLARETAGRGLTIDIGPADMRTIGTTVTGRFDVVVCCDNALPHLMTDADIATAFSQFRSVLRSGGLCVCSVRDYASVRHAGTERHAYGRRQRGDQRFHLWQEWRWTEATHYDVSFVVAEETPAGSVERLRTVTRYYAVGISRLLELMADGGFTSCRRQDDVFFQPLLIGRAT